MALKHKFYHKHALILRDARPMATRLAESLKDSTTAATIYVVLIVAMFAHPVAALFSDLLTVFGALYFWWLRSRVRKEVLPFRLPRSARRVDPNNPRPDGSLAPADGILYLGNDSESGEEIWFTNSDARTHCLYLGTTGSGKTFGLKSYACNALTWGSGFIYIDGKADTDLWSTLSAMARRFGRDDDLLIMNYMTGNSAGRIASNTLNPFSSGSASYLTNMLVSLMPDSEGENAMWKERAVALVSGLMPCLVWKRDNQNHPLSIGIIRQYLTFKSVIKLARDKALPELLRVPVQSYLNELPGYVDKVFDDNGDEKPPGPDVGNTDTSVPRQQHGYLSMQFTRSMQSLGDDYGFIFDTQAADIDMLDVVLNRRILIVLIPALEKSSDETANLGKIISSTLKGMMGATLGSTVEGDTATAIENKPTNSATPFITIFDEVGYYVAQGMAVMAAQARSLGFSLVFSSQDLPALEKRVKEEARSITANCNIKLFGKLEDPTQTKEFFDKTMGTVFVAEVSGYAMQNTGLNLGYQANQQANITARARADYDGLRGFSEGRAVCAFGKSVNEIQIYYSDIGHAKAMRVQRFLPIPPPTEEALDSLRQINTVVKRLRSQKWDPKAEPTPPQPDIEAMTRGFADARAASAGFVACGMAAVSAVAAAHGVIRPGDGEAAAAGAAAPSEQTVQAAVEVAAAEVAAEPANTGPLSWAQIVGTAEARPAQPFVAPPPSAPPVDNEAARARAAAAGLGGPLSWTDIIGGGGAVPAAAPAQKQQPPAAAPFLPPVDNQVQAQAAADAGLAKPISWTDIIGTDDQSKKGTGQ